MPQLTNPTAQFRHYFSYPRPACRIGLIGLLCVGILAGCAGVREDSGSQQVVVVESSPSTQPNNQDEGPIVSGLGEQEQVIVVGSPDGLVLQANDAVGEDRALLLLAAVEGYLESDNFAAARRTLTEVDNTVLSLQEVQRYHLLNATVAAQLNDANGLRQQLGIINVQQLTPVQRYQYHRLAARFGELSGNDRLAITHLVLANRYAEDAERLLSQDDILQRLGALSDNTLFQLNQLQEPVELPGWLALSALQGVTDRQQRYAELQRWRAQYPTHPAQLDDIDQTASSIGSEQYQQVALLLPLTSPVGRAAQAYYDGFAKAQQEDASPSKPNILLQDVGDQSELIGLYYEAAQRDGAQFVVGPLGRQATQVLLANRQLQLPTMVIADVPADLRNNGELFGIGLSPEAEARQVANHAWRQGHRRAGVMRSDSDWGQRVAVAFSEVWQSLGGILINEAVFQRGQTDYSLLIQRYFGLDSSSARHAQLSNRLGVNLKFSARRRNDLDFLFLAANAAEGRLLVPQIKFNQGHDLTLYATSYIYNAGDNKALDQDLDGVNFLDMPWMLPQQASSAEEPVIVDGEVVDTTTNNNVRTPSRYRGSTLERLYALGFASYQLLPRLTSMAHNSRLVFDTDAFSASVGGDGNVQRQLIWMRFKDGIPRRIN